MALAQASQSPAVQEDSPPCPLQDIAAELRQSILHFALVEQKPILVTIAHRLVHNEDAAGGCTSKWEQRVEPGDPAIAQTCRQLRAEALPEYYTNNTFLLHLHKNMPDQTYTLYGAICSRNLRLSVYRQYKDMAQGDLAGYGFGSAIRHVCLEFEIPAYFGRDHSATLDLLLNRDWSVDLKVMGGLERFCICDLRESAKRAKENKDGFWLLMGDFEKDTFQSIRGFRNGSLCPVCRKCGKLKPSQ